MLDIFTYREYSGFMLMSVDDIVCALGGTAAVAELCGVGSSTVSNWRARRRIPAERYLVLSAALTRAGEAASPSVFGLAPAEARP